MVRRTGQHGGVAIPAEEYTDLIAGSESTTRDDAATPRPPTRRNSSVPPTRAQTPATEVLNFEDAKESFTPPIMTEDGAVGIAA